MAEYLFCKQVVTVRFCGLAHMAMQRKLRKRCRYCGLECSRPCKIYCNNKCQRQYEIDKLVEEGKGGVNSCKHYLLKKNGYICSICKNTKWMGQIIPLILDHIDGNSDNWDFKNLRLVCGNCDMQLITYKGRNMGKGRYLRRKRYADGKSY